MKIAVLADPLDNQNAGVHIYTKHLVKELIKQAPKHEIILIRQNRDHDLKNIKQIIVPNINLPIGFASIRLFAIIPIILRKENVDVVIEPAHFGPFNLPSRIKRVTVIHDLTPIIFPEHHRWHSQILQKLFLKRILKKADLIITNSKHTSSDLELYFPFTKRKNKSIYLGKDQSFIPTINPKVLTKHKIEEPYFLSVGTIEPRKNLVRLLRAFEEFSKQYDREVQLVIAGGMGWKAQDLFTAIDQHPFKKRIKLLGYVEEQDLPVLYSMCVAMIYPSLYEGFGFPVLEALSCGTIVICSDTSSLPEVGGDYPFYVNPEDVNSIEEGMKDVIKLTKSEREKLREKGLNQADGFSWGKFGHEFLDTLEELVN